MPYVDRAVRRRLLPAVLCAALLLLPAATALAGNPHASPLREYATSQVTAGKKAALVVNTRGARYCRVAFKRGKHSVRSRIVRAKTKHLRWTWRVPRRASRGKWKATVRCAQSRKAVRRHHGSSTKVAFKVLRRGAGHKVTRFVKPGSLHVAFLSHAPAGLAAPTGGHVNAGRGAGHNPFDYGQCTYHAYEARPDVYDSAVAHGQPRYGWDAWIWLSRARAAGIPTGTVPVAGALVVFPKGYGGSSVGHIAYVERVNHDGSYLISERNWNYNHNITTRLVMPGYPGVGFIYGGPAGGGPGTVATTYHVTGTSSLNVYSGPGTGYAVVGSLPNGSKLDITCQTRSDSAVGGSTIWDRLSNGRYVPDYYTDTANFNDFSPPLARCATVAARSLGLTTAGKGYVLDGWGGLHPVGGAPAAQGPSWPGWDIARDTAVRSNGSSGYVLDGWGGIHPFGGAPAVGGYAYWQGWDIARAIGLRGNGTGGYVLDGWGALHPFGGAPAVGGGPYWQGWDIARDFALRSNGTSGYVLDGWGGVHPFGGAPAVGGYAYWQGWDIARSIALRPDGVSGYVLDGWGAVHAFGGAPALAASRYTQGVDDARRLTLTASGNGGWVVFTDGVVARFGDAPPVSASWHP